MTGNRKRSRTVAQNMVCYGVLKKYMPEDKLELILSELRYNMRKGPNSWAFKPEDKDGRSNTEVSDG